MSFWTVLEGGMSYPCRGTRGQKFAGAFGRFLAGLRKNIILNSACLVSPEAKLCARGCRIKVGKGSIIAAYALIQGNVEIGKGCSVQSFSILVGYPHGKVSIGNHVRIAPHCMMIGGNHIFTDPEQLICRQGIKERGIVVEDDVWIGGMVNILAGVTICRGSVVAAGAVVTKDVPPFSVVAGVPARVIKVRAEDSK